MRIRTIKPEFWTHPVLTRMEYGARLLAIALLNYADDEGFFYADIDLLKGAIMPREESTNVRRWIDELSRKGFLDLREHPEMGLLGKICNFKEHQRIDRAKPSKIGRLHSTIPRRTLDERSTLEQGTGNRERNSLESEKNSGPSEAPNLPIESQTADADLAGEKPKEVESKPRKRDPLFDTLAIACGLDLSGMTPREGRACGVALAEIRKATPNLTSDEIRNRAGRYGRVMPKGSTLTPNALANNWSRCANGAGQGGKFPDHLKGKAI